MPNHVNLRIATSDDAEAVALIHCDSWKAAYPGLLPDELLCAVTLDNRQKLWSTRLEKPGSTVHLLIEMDGVAVAFASFGPDRNGYELEEVASGGDSETAELYAIYARSTSWRNGFGTLLMNETIERCRRSGYKALVVWVLENNERAKKFYERFDMKLDRRETRTRDHYQLPGVRYRLDL